MKKFVFVIFIIMLAIITNCKKDDLTPLEMIYGQWELYKIEGADTSYNGQDIEWIVTYSIEEGLLKIEYDSITSTSIDEYKLSLIFDFKKDGALNIEEEYRDQSNNILISSNRQSSWHKDPFAWDSYSYYLFPYDQYTPYSPNNSRIFLHPYDEICLNSNNISKNNLVLIDNNGYRKILLYFKKL